MNTKFPLSLLFSAAFLLDAPYSVDAMCKDCCDGCKGRRALLDEQDVYDEILRCSSESYQVNLVAEPGPHFVLEAKHIKSTTTTTTSTNNSNCADLGFSSMLKNGEKVVHDTSKEEKQDSSSSKSFTLGSVDLGKIFVAHQAAEGISAEEYDLAMNNCVHFAAGIWRKLGFPETKELAEFLVDNTIGDIDRLQTFLIDSAGEEHPARIALESGSIRSYYEGIVKSQLFIVN